MIAVVYDPQKDRANVQKHGISLARAGDVEILRVIPVDRHAYGERRYRAFGLIDGTPYCLVFTIRAGKLRAISLRRAHAREMRRYGWQA